ncbi:MAG TPA: MoxR family ATPase [Candidatus Thermoplasmatota archaeon]|nr:MoxR family ATPase [Candidatus Thermoplasmatota archaeon]
MTDPAAIAKSLERARAEIARVVVGYDDVATDLLVGLLANGHVLLEGVPGIAKTTLAKTFATASGLTFKRVQFTQDLLPADITGHYYFDQKTEDFAMRRGPVFTNLLLADEINRAPPKTQSALLEAMEERQVTIEGRTFPLESPFMVIATMNPVDVEGVYKLPEAQLDRFMIRTRMGYLDPERERQMLEAKAFAAPRTVSPALDDKTLKAAQAAVQAVHVERDVVAYVQGVARATRDHPGVTLGASPRAMEQMMQAARAIALLDGRGHVLPDDVKYVAPRVLNHRIILHVDAEIEGKTPESAVADALAKVEVPKGPPARSAAFSVARRDTR